MTIEVYRATYLDDGDLLGYVLVENGAVAWFGKRTLDPINRERFETKVVMSKGGIAAYLKEFSIEGAEHILTVDALSEVSNAIKLINLLGV